MTRQEHLNWCKERALFILNDGDVQCAYSSFLSDMSSHEETKDHSALTLGMMLMISDNLSTSDQMKKFIDGFN